MTFTEQDVRQILTMPAAIECLRGAFMAYANGEAQNQPRRRLVLPTGAVLHQMAASYDGFFGTKVYSSHIKHGAYFTVLLYDAATARPLAQFEADALGQIRTGAASGLAADLLAPRKPIDVAIIGSGFQARTQIEALRAVRTVSGIRVWSRSPERRQAFAKEMSAVAASSAAAACEGADVIVTATHSKVPVLPSDAISGNALILAMGANWADRQEVPADIVRRSRLVIDDVEQGRQEAGDFLLAGVDWDSVTPLSEIIRTNNVGANNEAGPLKGRLTVFKSVGIALEDVAVAAYIYRQAILARPSAGPSPATR